MYFGEVTDPNIRHIFRDAGDFIVRPLKCGKFTLYAYAIDGLTSGADTSEYVISPLRIICGGIPSRRSIHRPSGGAFKQRGGPLPGPGHCGIEAGQRFLCHSLPWGRGYRL